MPREDWDDRAFTGLEAAIVFIAFIVVAAVFAYVVLGVGMTTSQKSQETMYAALGEAGSALRPGQSVIAKLDNDKGLIEFMEFDLETATDLAVIDMGSMTYTIATKKTLVTFPPGDPRVTVTWRYPKDGGPLLEAGEVVTVKLMVGSVEIGRGDTFTLQMTAAGGETAALTRNVPAGIGKNVYVELF
ncbi:Archaebacterial flagellin [Methanoculleus chikugoensis]|jgi:flagellin FlaB|uniref:Flagellin n=1 Tax=Methanoculleus chikugoensis TaxID=118126 RepID=A0A1M4MM93_9EURY|nr:archaellin/type IV pilin N-terminal domain-containing protein [Methanoculleus chikugoensis]MDD4566686.1 flagellin [Methanoculleus chikugoensis]NMA11145.1 flagellin [Methanomicrobiales archaeon]SCL76054.1 Archaebacterial flagellin [Methanoculleus chikugoensis]